MIALGSFLFGVSWGWLCIPVVSEDARHWKAAALVVIASTLATAALAEVYGSAVLTMLVTGMLVGGASCAIFRCELRRYVKLKAQ